MRKNIRKKTRRITSATLTAALLTGALLTTGCGVSSDSENAAAQNSAMAKLNAQNEENIIDDNYRTTYEIFVHSFYDSDGDRIGDLQGVIEKLDYIEDMGFNQIWLMPIMPSPSYHKYDVTDYMDIDSQYGSLDDFDELVEQCHDRGINIIIDFVMNHTSSEHPWFTQAADYIKTLGADEEPDVSECPYVDYYNFSREPGTGYNKLADTDWYYESQFVDTMPDLNLQSDAVRNEFDDIVSFWLDRGVDGFRLDAVLYYNNSNMAESIEDLSWIVETVKSKKSDAYMVGEGWTNAQMYAQYYTSGIDSMFDFDFSQRDGYIAKVLNNSVKSGASKYGQAIEDTNSLISQYSDTYIDAPFYTNHDVGRSAGYYSGDNAENKTKMAQAMNLLMQGNTFLYYGEEIGMKGSQNDEAKRLAMRWTEDTEAKGMCDDPDNAKKTDQIYDTLDNQENNLYSIYNFVKQTMAIRNTFPEIARGTNEFISDLSDKNVCVLTREYDGNKIVLVFNTSDEDTNVDMSSFGDVKLSAMLQTSEAAPEYADGTLSIPAYSVAVFE